MAKLYGVGVGPGDPELMTLKALRIIRQSDIIAVPRSGKSENIAYTIAKGAFPSLDEKKLIEIDMPMTRNMEKLEESHKNAAKTITKWLDLGKDVAFLTLGDPTIYSTYSYIQNMLDADGYETEIVPGVPSFCAAAGMINHSLVERDEPLHIIPASYEGVMETLAMKGTKVLMKSGKSLGKIKKIIQEMPVPPIVKMVERCGMEDEKIYNSLDEIDEKAGYFSVIIIRERKI